MTSPPLYMTPVPASDIGRGDGAIVTDFVQGYCRITKESLGGKAGTLLKTRQWQDNILGCTYARRSDGRLRHRQALIGLPRKNGKSALGSSMGLYGLITGEPGAEVYSCAVDKEQARVVFNVAKRMVELDPMLDDRQGGILHIYRDSIVYPEKGSIYKVLSSEAITKEGLNPTAVIYDEIHGAPDSELYDVMTMAMGARRDPILIAITTAGVKSDKTGRDSTCYKLYQRGMKICKDFEAGKPVTDNSFFMAWWGAPDGADHTDPEVWAAANPGYDDLIDPEDFKFALTSVHENEFRTKRLNQWVSAQQAWLPNGAWKDCYSGREFTPGARGVVLGFDGSQNQDTTALVAVTVDSEPQVIVLGHWQKPASPDADWQVPRGEVKDAIRRACRDYHVREVAADEYRWQDALEELAAEGLPIVTFPQTLSRMAPATQRTYEMVVNRKVSHDGNPELARHFDNAQLKTDSRGSRIVKDAKNSPRKIDLAMATVMALDRAGFFMTEPLEGTIDGIPVAQVQFVWGDGDDRVSAGERCGRCGNPKIRELKRIGIQVVCDPPCGTPRIGPPDNGPETFRGLGVG